jgi:hypothetical protein
MEKLMSLSQRLAHGSLLNMWELSSCNKIKQWTVLGEYQCMIDAARRILELESDDSLGFFFRIYVDPFYRHNRAFRCRAFFALGMSGEKSLLSPEA